MREFVPVMVDSLIDGESVHRGVITLFHVGFVNGNRVTVG